MMTHEFRTPAPLIIISPPSPRALPPSTPLLSPPSSFFLSSCISPLPPCPCGVAPCSTQRHHMGVNLVSAQRPSSQGFATNGREAPKDDLPSSCVVVCVASPSASTLRSNGQHCIRGESSFRNTWRSVLLYPMAGSSGSV